MNPARQPAHRYWPDDDPMGHRVQRNLSSSPVPALYIPYGHGFAEPSLTFALRTIGDPLIGLYGVLSEAVAERRHELGIRLALGAAPRTLLGLVLRQAMTVTAIGLVFGLLATLALRRLVASQLFGISASDPASLMLAAGLLFTVALVAALVPARRAAATDPLSALRHD